MRCTCCTALTPAVTVRVLAVALTRPLALTVTACASVPASAPVKAMSSPISPLLDCWALTLTLTLPAPMVFSRASSLCTRAASVVASEL